MSKDGGGNWSSPVVGTTETGQTVTASFGSGPAEGHTLLADGAVAPGTFMQSGNHDHYGPGGGANNNGTSRGAYTGPGSK